MLLTGFQDNAGVLISAWIHDELGISMFALDACICYRQTLHSVFGQDHEQHLISFSVHSCK